jgi:hypothetical protein
MDRLRPWYRDGGDDTGIGRLDPVEALQWLDRQVIDDADAGQLRDCAAGLGDGTDWSRLDDAQVKRLVAAALENGRLRTGTGAPVQLQFLGQAQAPAATPAPAPAPAPVSRPRPAAAATPAASPSGDATFGSDLDVAAMVATLRAAADDGVPFCEECAKAAARQQLAQAQA